MLRSLDRKELAAAMMPKPLSPEQAVLQHRLFTETVEPIRQMKLRLYSLYLPTIILDSEGRLVSAAYPDEMLELVKKLDEEIERIAATWSPP